MFIEIDELKIIDGLIKNINDSFKNMIDNKIAEYAIDEFDLAVIEDKVKKNISDYISRQCKQKIKEEVNSALKNIFEVDNITKIYHQWAVIHRLEKKIIQLQDEINIFKKSNKQEISSYVS